jgi:hypothetical protein
MAMLPALPNVRASPVRVSCLMAPECWARDCWASGHSRRSIVLQMPSVMLSVLYGQERAMESWVREARCCMTAMKRRDGRSPENGRFLAGENWTGNRAGHPKGSRRKQLAREFIEAMQNTWEEHGQQVLETVIKEDPATFMRAMVAIMPKELDVIVTRYDGMTE